MRPHYLAPTTFWRPRKNNRVSRFTTPALCVALCAFGAVAFAQRDDATKQESVKPVEVQPPFAPAKINFRERPKYPVEAQRLRRTVQVDGTLGEGEWDAFYTINDGPFRGTIYCNWDDNYLYLATKSETPASVVFNVDSSGDGWLRGADNLELVIENAVGATAPLLTLRLLDAANSKDTPVWNEKAYDPKGVLVASKVVGGVQTVEVGIPKSMANLLLKDGVTFGLRAEFVPPTLGAFQPTQPFEPHLLLDATLVASRDQAASGINPQLLISDEKCVAGQELTATLRLLNQTDQTIAVKSVLWTGQGNSANVLNTLREVAVPSIPPVKTREVKYRTVLPNNLSPGTYTLSVVAELDGGRQVQSTRTFTVVEPLQVSLSGEPNPVAIVGTTKYTLLLDVTTAVPKYTKAEVELTQIPAGWELEGRKYRGVEIDGQDRRKVARFKFKIPSTTPAGAYNFEANVTLRGKTWTVRHVARVLRASDPMPSKPNP